MVLFVFVIMLLNAGAEARQGPLADRAASSACPLLVALLGCWSYFVQRWFPDAPCVHFGGFTGGTALDVGRALFTTYLLPFEITSLLILIAILGAVVLARKELD